MQITYTTDVYKSNVNALLDEGFVIMETYRAKINDTVRQDEYEQEQDEHNVYCFMGFPKPIEELSENAKKLVGLTKPQQTNDTSSFDEDKPF